MLRPACDETRYEPALSLKGHRLLWCNPHWPVGHTNLRKEQVERSPPRVRAAGVRSCQELQSENFRPLCFSKLPCGKRGVFRLFDSFSARVERCEISRLYLVSAGPQRQLTQAARIYDRGTTVLQDLGCWQGTKNLRSLHDVPLRARKLVSARAWPRQEQERLWRRGYARCAYRGTFPKRRWGQAGDWARRGRSPCRRA